MKKNKKIFDIVLNLVLIVLCICVVLPFIMIVSISLSNEKDIIEFGYSIIPKNFDLSAYQYVFQNSGSILNAYKVTFIFSALSMVLSTFLMALISYPLSRRDFRQRNAVSFMLFFTMLFNGGLVPTYLLITQYLHLDDTIWVYILPSMISPWYVFMLRTSIAGIPEEVVEAATIDGSGEYGIFFKIILPLSKPVLATVGLMIFLVKWNDWYVSMLYINDQNLVSLQYFLQRIMQNINLIKNADAGMAGMLNASEIPTETVRMAMAVVVAGPALFVFPFFQKYFVKGMTVGSVKG